MSYVSPKIVEIEHPETADYPYAVVYDVEIEGKAYHLARICPDGETGKWWLIVGRHHYTDLHPSLEDAIEAARKTFPSSIREHLASLAELSVRRDGKFRTEACSPEIPWLGWVEFARQILEIDGKYRPHMIGGAA